VTAPLTADRIVEALGMMERFYAEMRLDFVRERARAALEDLHSFGGWWFLTRDGATIGYFVLTLGYSLEFGGRFALLDEFFIEREWRGRGTGTAAMTEILNEARAMGAGAVHLEADADVQPFYAKSGFKPRDREMMTRWL
jgi:GNAT superfamily N-acetyltransferase